MCMPKPSKPKIQVADMVVDPRVADEQIALATRIAEETKSKRMSAFRDSIATTGSRGVLTAPTTTASIAGGAA
jgi:hypothetical protein